MVKNEIRQILFSKATFVQNIADLVHFSLQCLQCLEPHWNFGDPTAPAGDPYCDLAESAEDPRGY